MNLLIKVTFCSAAFKTTHGQSQPLLLAQPDALPISETLTATSHNRVELK